MKRIICVPHNGSIHHFPTIGDICINCRWDTNGALEAAEARALSSAKEDEKTENHLDVNCKDNRQDKGKKWGVFILLVIWIWRRWSEVAFQFPSLDGTCHSINADYKLGVYSSFHEIKIFTATVRKDTFWKLRDLHIQKMLAMLERILWVMDDVGKHSMIMM